jgi:alpha-L-fucosidase 2
LLKPRILLLIAVNLISVNLHSQKLWYDKPAEQWIEALPAGNGRMGAMVFGDPVNERIQLNEDSLWPGGPDWADKNSGTPEDLEHPETACVRAIMLKQIKCWLKVSQTNR